jgi:hypothetical protein
MSFNSAIHCIDSVDLLHYSIIITRRCGSCNLFNPNFIAVKSEPIMKREPSVEVIDLLDDTPTKTPIPPAQRRHKNVAIHIPKLR